jgi:Fuc2NAc and GlcNAc transferase
VTAANWIIAAVAFVAALALVGLTRRIALARAVLDVPNERSSHTVPTPVGGGIAIVLAATAALVALRALDQLDVELLIALGGGGLAVAAVGLLDDRYRLAPRTRIVVHFAAALWALAWLGGLPPLRLGSTLVDTGWFGYALGALGIVWTLNLFNFMDGIDGLAGTEAVFVTFSGALLATASPVPGVAPAAVAIGAASAGFLVWNWPPAKIFMGDVGSGYLGYAIAVLALAAARTDPSALSAWFVLGGAFFVDATLTLARRVVRGQRVQEAHRSHAYQRLARRWRSHGAVTVAVAMINVVWLLPCAWLIERYPGAGAWLVLTALLPVAIAALVAGSGRA